MCMEILTNLYKNPKRSVYGFLDRTRIKSTNINPNKVTEERSLFSTIRTLELTELNRTDSIGLSTCLYIQHEVVHPSSYAEKYWKRHLFIVHIQVIYSKSSCSSYSLPLSYHPAWVPFPRKVYILPSETMRKETSPIMSVIRVGNLYNLNCAN